jgi:hypothetical protein
MQVVDTVLIGDAVQLEFESVAEAKTFAKRCRQLGAAAKATNDQ